MAALPLAVNVTVLVPVVGLVPNPAVTPLGNPEADRVTLPVKPFDGVMVIVLLPLPPCVIVTLFGDGDRLKSCVAAAVTVSDTLVEWVVLALVPVIVML